MIGVIRRIFLNDKNLRNNSIFLNTNHYIIMLVLKCLKFLMSKTNIIDKKTFAIVVLIILGLVLYIRTGGYDFVWDDVPLYLNTNNYPETGRLDNFEKFWTPGEMPMYAPITYTFWAVIASISAGDNTNKAGLSPVLFHFSNVFFHIVNSVLVFLILLYLFKNNLVALSAALVFLLHPIQVEPVAWISELRGLLAAFFGFSAILLYVKNRIDNSPMEQIKLYHIGVIVFLILSFLSKPVGVVFPFILLALDYFFLKAEKKLLLINAIILSLITVLFILLSVSAEGGAEEIIKISFFNRLFLPLYSFVFYLYKAIIPVNFSAVYGLTPEYLVSGSQLYIFAAIFVVIMILLFIKRHQLKHITAGLFISFIAILPTSGLVAYYYQTFSNVADRYFYIAMFGITIVLYFIFSKIKHRQRILIPASVAILLFILSSYQLSSWSNDFKHWDNIIKKSLIEIPQAYMGRGEENLNLGNYPQAIDDFTKAIDINPGEALYYYNRANAYLDLKQYNLAVKDYSFAIARNDKLVSAYVNRGLAYMEFGDPLPAIPDFTKALLFNPQQPDICNNIGICYAMTGQYDSAAVYFRRTLVIKSNDTDAIENLKLLEIEINKKEN